MPAARGCGTVERNKPSEVSIFVVASPRRQAWTLKPYQKKKTGSDDGLKGSVPKNAAVELTDFSVVTFPYSPKDDQMYMRLCKYPNMAETPAFRMFGAWHKRHKACIEKEQKKNKTTQNKITQCSWWFQPI